MKYKLVLPIAILLSFSFSSVYALNITDESKQATTNNALNNDNLKKDGEELAWLIVVDKSEISAAKEVLKRKVSPEIKQYAIMLYNNHTKNLKSTLKIGEKMGAKLVDTDAVISLKKNEENELAKLKTLDDKAFQLTFLNAMIKGHTEVLQKINQDLQNISNPALKNHFELTGKMIEKHLDKAKSILNNLKSNS